MSTFNAGAIEANLTLGRSSWTKDLRNVKREIADLERKSITIGIDADADNALVAMNNVEMLAESLDDTTYTPTIDADSDEFNRAMEAIDAKLDALDDRRVVVEVWADTDNAQVSLDNLENDLNVLDSDPVNIAINIVTREADAILDALEARLDRLEARDISIAADADIDNAMVQLDNLENQMDLLENDPVNIGVDVDSLDAETKMIELSLQMQRMSMSGIDIPVGLDGYAKTIAQMNILEAQTDILDGRDIDLDIDIDRKALTDLVGAGGGAAGGGGGHLGLLRILIYSLIALSPILAVAISSLTAAIVAFVAAAAGAAGAALILGAGIFGLVKRFQDAKEAGDELSKPMERLDDAIGAVGDSWDKFLDKIEGPGFNLMADALELVADILPTLSPLFNETADMMGGILDGIREFVESPEYDEMLDFFGGFGVDMLESFLIIGGNLLQFFGRLFQAIEPFAREMMQGLEDTTAGWAEWADDLENNESFQKFVDNALEYGPMLLDMLGSLLDAFQKIGEALEPFAGPMLEGLTWLFDLIANAPVEVLTALIAGFAGLWLGMSVVAPIISAVGGALTVIGTALGVTVGPVLLLVGAVAALVWVIQDLWRNNETFRDAVIDTWNRIVETVRPIVEDIVAFLKENWGPMKEWATGIWRDIKGAVVDAMVIIRQIVRGVTTVVSAIWGRFGDNILRQAKTAFTMIGSIIRGAFQIIRGIFQTFRGILTGDTQMMWQGLQNIWRGAVRIVGGIFRGLFETVRNTLGNIREAFNSVIEFFRGIGGRIQSATSGIWDSLWTSFRNVVNDIIRMWNNLSFTIDIPDRIPGLPSGFTVSTPNVPYMAKGAYVTDPTLAVVGEGGEPEIVSPESKMREIVRENGGANIDYGRLAAVIVAAFTEVLSRTGGALAGGLSREDLALLLEGAGVNVQIDARDESGAPALLAQALGFELKRLGFGGKHNG